MQLSVIIVSYNVRHYLVQCLDSVFRASRDIRVEVFVVDNASTDGSVDYARRFFPQVHYIENTENVGFARANNQAIRQSAGEYVLLLNPDTVVGEDVLRGAIDFMNAHPQAGATGTQMINRDGSFAFESRRGIPYPATAFYKITGLCSLFPRNRVFGRYYMRYLDAAKPARIEAVSGAFFLLRRTALEQAGLLCEDYFMYGEDIDLSYTLLQLGWQNWYQPFRILHYKGESTQKTSFRYVHSFYDAMLIFFNKHLARRYRLAALLIKPAVVMRGVMEMVRQQIRRVKNIILAVLHPQHPDRLLFVGTEQAWALMADITRRGGMIPIRCTASAAEGGHLQLPDVARTCSCIVYQTDAPEVTYARILELLNTGHRLQQHRSHLGTFSMQTQTLILPNDILQ
ncbi:MAG: glycosyltransferase family 2 protein [Bacteroidaceae bacterium]|nr:glycosyltransferase family 2 protein [Bacteroidaceae bacterium]